MRQVSHSHPPPDAVSRAANVARATRSPGTAP